MMMKNKALAFLFGCFSFVFLGLFFTSNTYAAFDDNDPIMQKIYYSGAVDCYKTKEDAGGLADTKTLTFFDGTAGSIGYEGGINGGALTAKTLTYGESDERISCEDLLTNKTANHFSSTTGDITDATKKTILNNMAYSVSGDSDSGDKNTCAQYPYVLKYADGGTATFNTPGVCITKNGGNWEFSVDNTVGLTEGGYPKPTPVYFDKEGTNTIRIRYSYKGGIFGNSHGKVTLTVNGSDSAQAVLASVGDAILQAIGSTENNSTELRGVLKSQGRDGVDAVYWSLCPDYIATLNGNGLTCGQGAEQNAYNVTFYNSEESASLTYKKIDMSAIGANDELVKKLSKNKWTYSYNQLNRLNESSLKFTESQTYSLYQSYLTDVYGAKIDCFATVNNGAGEGPIRLWDPSFGYDGFCYAVIDDDTKMVNGLTDDGYFGVEINLDTMISQINALNITAAPTNPIDTGDGSATYDEEASCYSSAVKSLGWVLCPVLEFLTEASGDLYDKYVEPALTLNSTLFDSNQQGGKATYDAWSGFRDIANVIFAVLFLAVIFSQLTGIGIDNYGIKKILPKMIIAAILINVSYLVCTLLIDLSNIVGSGVQGIFSNMKVDGASSLSVGGTTQTIAATAISSVAVLTTLVTSVAAVWSNPSIILTLLISALGTIIAIFFLFVILAAREAAVLVLTVISPIAVVLYMLPNTKKMFDKWMKAFQTLLLLFPICGLLVGGGNFVSKLLLASSASGGFFSALMAMIVGIAPIFFIPSLLSNSLKALGNIGAKISSVGGKLGKGVTSGIRGFEGFKNAQQFGAERRTRIKAGFDAQGNQKNLNAFQRAIRGGSRNVERYRGKYQRLVAERGSLEATEGQDFMLETDINNELKRINSSGEINSNAALQAGLANALANGDRAKIGAYTDALSNKGEDGRQAVKNAYESMVGKMSDLSARTFADNIMKKHGANYKNNSRSMFEVVKAISASDPNASGSARSAAVSVNNFAKTNRAFLAGKSTSVTLGNMDDDAFAETFGGYNSGNPVSIPDGADAAAIGAAAYDALHDQNANIKVERRKYLEELAKYAPAREQNVNIVGGSVDANVTNPVLNVRNVDGNANANGAVDVNIKQNNDQNGPVDDAGQII